jgi:hypothetical protein
MAQRHIPEGRDAHLHGGENFGTPHSLIRTLQSEVKEKQFAKMFTPVQTRKTIP